MLIGHEVSKKPEGQLLISSFFRRSYTAGRETPIRMVTQTFQPAQEEFFLTTHGKKIDKL